ncbi:MAG: hypothetical protein WDW38_004010 [Sanguina aurantia]
MSESGLRTFGLRYRQGSPFITYISIKQHKGADTVGGSSVFVAGLPFGFDDALVAQLFACFGEVAQVVLHSSKRSGIVVYTSESGSRAALKIAGTGQLIEFYPDEAEGPVGVKAWVQEYKQQRPGNAVLQKQLDDWMGAYEAAEEKKKRDKQQAMGEDGWTVVVRSKGRKKTKESDGMTVMTGGVASAAAAEVYKNKKVKKEENFYRFQQREQRRDELLDLRSKFDEDKKRVAQLKTTRHFKPY